MCGGVVVAVGGGEGGTLESTLVGSTAGGGSMGNVLRWDCAKCWCVSFVLCKREARRKIAFAVSSPADSDGIKGFGGFRSSATMSKAVCFRKSLILTSG